MNRLSFILFCLISAGSQAQTTPAATKNALDAYWAFETAPGPSQAALSISQTVIPGSPSINTIVLEQTGSANQANLQLGSGAQNLLDVRQSSGGNVADAMLSGTNNSFILSQTGGGNVTTFDLNGTNNRYLLSQDGGDTARLSGLQKDNTRLELVQGSGNNSFTIDNSTLLKDPLSSGIPNLRIEQTGGASIRVEQGRIIGNQP